MDTKEKVAYLQGLAEGMKIDSTNEGKLLLGIIDTLACIADELDALNENALDIGEELDALSDDLADVENTLELLGPGFDDDMDFDEDDWDFDDFEEYDGDDDEDNLPCHCEVCSAGDDDDVDYKIDIYCTECGKMITLTEEDIANESVTCSVCGKVLELQIDEVDADEE